MYCSGPLHMDEQRQDDLLEPTYSSSVPIRNVALRICQKQWTIEKVGKRGSGISVLMARDDDDDMYKKVLSLNNLICLICYQTKPNQIKPIQISVLISVQLRLIQR